MSIEKHACIDCWKRQFPAKGFKKRDQILFCRILKICIPADRRSYCTYWRERTADRRVKKIDGRSRQLLLVQMSYKNDVREGRAEKLRKIRDSIK